MPTTVSWPADRLPLPTFDGYGVQPLDAALRTDMESGPARQRLIYTAVPERIAVRWRFSDWQYAIFRAWYRHKAKQGAEWFSIDLLNALGIAAHEARFVGRGAAPYDAKPRRGTGWIVTSTLEVRKSPDLTEEALDLALVEDIEDLLAAMAAFNATIHVSLPGSGGWN